MKVFLWRPRPQNNMNVEQMKQIAILNKFWNLSPPWPYHEVDMLSRVIATNLPACPLQKTTSVLTLELTWHLKSWFKCHFLPLQQNNMSNKFKQFILSHFWKLRPPDPTQQHVKHVKKIGTLSHFVDFVTVLSKALRSTYEPTWHPESCSKCILYSSKNNTLNIRMNICLEPFPPPPFPIRTLNKWRKIASWVIL